MSDLARPDLAAVRDLERLVRHLGDELATFRRRALDAERRVREMTGARGEADPHDLTERVSRLERENGELRTRLDEAAMRTRQMVERVRFLRQQQDPDGC